MIVAIAACTSEKPRATADTSVNRPAPPPVTEEPRGGPWDVTWGGIGELKAGMSIEEANVVMHNALAAPAKISECDYIKVNNAPAGVAFMFENGVFSRVDVNSGTVKTVQGVGIGDTEDKIKSTYSGQVAVNPAKYTDGHTIVVTPKSGGNNRIVFETEGGKVTRFRSGREPAVEYVEGCA